MAPQEPLTGTGLRTPGPPPSPESSSRCCSAWPSSSSSSRHRPIRPKPTRGCQIRPAAPPSPSRSTWCRSPASPSCGSSESSGTGSGTRRPVLRIGLPRQRPAVRRHVVRQGRLRRRADRRYGSGIGGDARPGRAGPRPAEHLAAAAPVRDEDGRGIHHQHGYHRTADQRHSEVDRDSRNRYRRRLAGQRRPDGMGGAAVPRLDPATQPGHPAHSMETVSRRSRDNSRRGMISNRARVSPGSEAFQRQDHADRDPARQACHLRASTGGKRLHAEDRCGRVSALVAGSAALASRPIC